jgi:hypothetical protein
MIKGKPGNKKNNKIIGQTEEKVGAYTIHRFRDCCRC